jgi:lipopolysaccharide exporter
MSSPEIAHAQVSSSELKEAAVSGVRWVAAARVAAELFTVVSAVALARLIPPSEFGEAVVPLIFVPLAVILTFEGFGSALVQRRTVERGHVEAAALASIVTGLGLTLATLALAGPVAGWLFGHAVAELLRLVSPVFLLGGIGAVSRGLMWRRLDFRRMSLIELSSLALGALSSLGMALAGLDAEALVLGALLTTATTTVLLLASIPPPLPRWHRREFGEVVRFGLPASGAGLAYVAVTNSTLAVAASRLTSAQVGLYWRAFQLGVVYQDKISGIMMRLAFPVYSRTEDLDEMRRFHERATRIHAAVIVPLLALLIVIAPDAVPWAFGEAWRPAAPAVQVLAVAGMIAAILTGYPQLMLAAGKPRALFAFNMIVLALYVGTAWVAAPHGIVAVSVAVVAVHLVVLVSVYGLLFKRLLGIPVRRLVTDLLPGVAGSVALLAAGFPLAEALRGAGAPAPVTIAVVACVGAVVYASVLRGLFPAVWGDTAGLARRVLPGRPLLRRRAVASGSVR